MDRPALLGLALACSLATAASAQPADEPLGMTANAVTFAFEANLNDRRAAPGRGEQHAAVSYRERAHALRASHNFDLAIADYTRALDNSPRDADSLYGRGRSYHGAGNIGKAIEDYTQAVALRPKWSGAYGWRAHAHFAQGQLALAMTDFKRALEYDPKEIRHLVALGFVRLYLGDFPVAAGNLARALNVGSDPRAILALYLARIRIGERAMPELAANAQRVKPDEWPSPLLRFYLQVGSKADVLAAARTADQRCEALYYLGQWQLLHGPRSEALVNLEQAARVCAKTSVEYAGAAADLRRHR